MCQKTLPENLVCPYNAVLGSRFCEIHYGQELVKQFLERPKTCDILGEMDVFIATENGHEHSIRKVPCGRELNGSKVCKMHSCNIWTRRGRGRR